MAEIHQVNWELTIMLPQIITTTLNPCGQYPSIRYQNWCALLAHQLSFRTSLIASVLSGMKDAISSCRYSHSTHYVLIALAIEIEIKLEKQIHCLTLEKMVTANAQFQVHMHGTVKRSSSRWYLKWNVVLFLNAFRLPDCCRRNRRRIMQTRPRRRVQDIIRCLTALKRLHTSRLVKFSLK